MSAKIVLEISKSQLKRDARESTLHIVFLAERAAFNTIAKKYRVVINNHDEICAIYAAGKIPAAMVNEVLSVVILPARMEELERSGEIKIVE
jgi:hypothetical protein